MKTGCSTRLAHLLCCVEISVAIGAPLPMGARSVRGEVLRTWIVDENNGMCTLGMWSLKPV